MDDQGRDRKKWWRWKKHMWTRIRNANVLSIGLQTAPMEYEMLFFYFELCFTLTVEKTKNRQTYVGMGRGVKMTLLRVQIAIKSSVRVFRSYVVYALP